MKSLKSILSEFNFNLLNNIHKFTQEKFILPLANLDELKKDPLKITEYWKSAQLRINLDNQIKNFSKEVESINPNTNFIFLHIYYFKNLICKFRSKKLYLLKYDSTNYKRHKNFGSNSV